MEQNQMSEKTKLKVTWGFGIFFIIASIVKVADGGTLFFSKIIWVITGVVAAVVVIKEAAKYKKKT